MIVSVRPGAPVESTLDAVRAAMAAATGGEVKLRNPAGRPWAVLQFTPLPDAEARVPLLASELAAQFDLTYAEPDFIGSAHGVPPPNDPKYAEQWWSKKIRIESMWQLTQGSSHVLLAIADSGICIPSHPDLAGTRFARGYDYTSILFPLDQVPDDRDGHGTHVAGIAAATANNFEGVAGANWSSPVYITRVLNRNAVTASAVKLAVNDVARMVQPSTLMAIVDPLGIWRRRAVINLSFGFQIKFAALEQMCEETGGGDVILCVAAFPLGTSNTQIDYPAALAATYDHVFSVGATDDQDNIIHPMGMTDYSAITIFAPGTNILSTVPPFVCPFNQYGNLLYAPAQGSSQACPIVSGAASLIWSWHRDLSPADIKQWLIDAAAQVPHDSRTYPRLDLKPISQRRRLMDWFRYS